MLTMQELDEVLLGKIDKTPVVSLKKVIRNMMKENDSDKKKMSELEQEMKYLKDNIENRENMIKDHFEAIKAIENAPWISAVKPILEKEEVVSE